MKNLVGQSLVIYSRKNNANSNVGKKIRVVDMDEGLYIVRDLETGELSYFSQDILDKMFLRNVHKIKGIHHKGSNPNKIVNIIEDINVLKNNKNGR